ncbi:FAD-dependent oxidoreductase [Halomonas sp. GFAJ-1]|uniref:FAD-dependent oxidoreductase n=1 Tax=Halomonas sp. GFAJ-1 TaxID=1118153 RepID=UPI00023A1B9A|nr:FAD-dependent oxidoreductase [Halomonas sp. GFAJ-1]AVI61378.1 pyridine nucleotide-disulfide oxidoreductase [Halomonas sp. GFAJ-1]EHK59569.1 pyridine nucleotide-disulfide oxidoreductase family protein [Halomonas sp. GFAJ-1]
MPPMKHLVLIGAGHAHAFVLEAFAQRPDPAIAITVVSDSNLAAYSGSVPTWLAGECTLRETQIDVAALSQRAGAHLITSPAVAIDPTKRRVTLANGEVIQFDVASFNVGSTLRLPEQSLPEQKFSKTHDELRPYLLAMRPLSSLHHRWQALREKIDQLPTGTHQRVVSVGGGAAGCETLMSVLAQLRQQRADITWQGTLVSASPTLLPGAGRLPRWLTKRALHRAGITLRHGVRGQALIAGGVRTSEGELIDADIVLWATGAVGQAWLKDTALPLDQHGFIQVNKTLEVASQPGLFAAGDCAAFNPPLHTSPLHVSSLPKAGVYAVRMGPLLADNLRAACHHEPLAAWQPPKRVLALIGTGDGHAIASRGEIGFSGRWVWEWKKRIDARFIARFNPPFKS